MSDSSQVEIMCTEGGITWTKIKSLQNEKRAVKEMNAEQAAVALDKALTSMDIRAVVDILTKTSSIRRMEIAEAYRIKFGKVITFPDAKNKVKSNFKKVLSSLITPLPTFLAYELHEAITSIRVDEDTILEILCAQSNYWIALTTSEYENLYGRHESKRWVGSVRNEDDEDTITTKYSGSREVVFGCSLEMDLLEMDAPQEFLGLCIALSSGGRSLETDKVNEERVKADALALYNAGGRRYWWSDDENESLAAVELAAWRAIFTQRSRKHLLQIFKAYNDLTGTSIEEAIKIQFTGLVRKGFLTLVSCIKDKASYFAERLHRSLKGLGTDDDTLIRVVVSNAGVGISNIKRAFRNKYNVTLEEWIEDDTSGDYKKILLSIVSPAKDSDEESNIKIKT